MAEQAKRNIRSWLIPTIVLLVVGALAVFALTLGKPDQSMPEATAPTRAAPTEVQQPVQPDLLEVERRDPHDLLSAGPVDAPVGLVIFSDYQCPFCAKWSHETLPLMQEYADAGQLRIEWRDVNVFGKDSERAALASYAAAQQDSFWQYHDALFADGKHRKGSELSDGALVDLAGELGLDRTQFTEDFGSPATAKEIARNVQLGLDLGAHSTPVFLLNGQPIVGAQPSETFVGAVDRALAAHGAK